MVWSWQLLTLGHYLARRTTHCGHQYVTEPVSGVKIKNKIIISSAPFTLLVATLRTKHFAILDTSIVYALQSASATQTVVTATKKNKHFDRFAKPPTATAMIGLLYEKKKKNAVLEQFLGHVIPNDLIPKRFVQF